MGYKQLVLLLTRNLFSFKEGLTSWNRVFLEKLTSFDWSRNSLLFMKS